MSRSSAASSPLIKGYLPLRVKIPNSYASSLSSLDSSDEQQEQQQSKQSSSSPFVTTFLYVKEHQSGTTSNNNDQSQRRTTLFVANAPILPGISTQLLLQSIFGRYGDVVRVTVVPNPRRRKQFMGNDEAVMADDGGNISHRGSMVQLSSWTTSFQAPSFLPSLYVFRGPRLGGGGADGGTRVGKFADVVMKTPKDLKRTLQHLSQVMTSSSQSDDLDDEQHNYLPGISFDKVELQTLADETHRQQEHLLLPYQQNTNSSDDDDDGGGDNRYRRSGNVEDEAMGGLQAVVHRYRQSRQHLLDRSALLEECNRVMEQWEQAEETRGQAREAAANEPDDDGFVTVSYGSASALTTGEDDAQEQGGGGGQAASATTTSTTNKRRARSLKRSRGNKSKKNNNGNNNNSNGQKLSGADPLPDFYRFQTKENRKRTLHELRERFEEDLAKVKKLKEEKQYRPF